VDLISVLQQAAPYLASVAVGILAALYGPYIADSIRTRRDKGRLSRALHLELAYIYVEIGEFWRRYYRPGESFDNAFERFKKMDHDSLERLKNDLEWYKSAVYDNNLYVSMGSDTQLFEVFYQIGDAVGIANANKSLGLAFSDDKSSPKTDVERFRLLVSGLGYFDQAVKDGTLSAKSLLKASKRIHYGQAYLKPQLTTLKRQQEWYSLKDRILRRQPITYTFIPVREETYQAFYDFIHRRAQQLRRDVTEDDAFVELLGWGGYLVRRQQPFVKWQQLKRSLRDLVFGHAYISHSSWLEVRDSTQEAFLRFTDNLSGESSDEVTQDLAVRELLKQERDSNYAPSPSTR